MREQQVLTFIEVNPFYNLPKKFNMNLHSLSKIY